MSSCPGDRFIHWESVTFSYGDNSKKNVLDGVTLAVSADRFTVITGPSGCGKSTLLYLAAGLYPAYGGTLRGGRITVEGVSPAELSPEKRAEILTMMFQNPDLQFCMDTVENELLFCMENVSVPVEEMDGRLDEALELCGVTHLRHRLLTTLSGGEKQRVMLACAAVLRPKWLLLDEPFANLDEKSAVDLVKKLRRLHDESGMGILAVDHDPWLWRSAADDLIVLSAEGGTVRQTLDLNSASPETLTVLGVSCPAAPYQSAKPPKKSSESYPLEIKDLTVHRGGTAVIGGLSVRFRAGHIHAVLGESGCGKSTFFHALCGLEKYGGSILVNGQELRSVKKKKLGGVMGFVFQNPQDQFVADTVLGEITLSLRSGNSEDIEGEAKRILKEIGLWRHRNLSPYMLSQGQQRRLGTAALLAYRCSILVCDEPTYAQDRNGVIAVMDELQRRVTEEGLTLVFSTHDTLLAENYADFIYEIREGRLYEKN